MSTYNLCNKSTWSQAFYHFHHQKSTLATYPSSTVINLQAMITFIENNHTKDELGINTSFFEEDIEFLLTAIKMLTSYDYEVIVFSNNRSPAISPVLEETERRRRGEPVNFHTIELIAFKRDKYEEFMRAARINPQRPIDPAIAKIAALHSTNEDNPESWIDYD